MHLGRGGGRSRASWRSRALHSSGSAWNRGRSHASKAPVVESPLGPLVAQVTVDNASNYSVSAEDAKISDCRYAASYSLIDPRPSQKIIIPGQPATWKPPQLPAQLQGDHGEYLRDQNGAHFPDYPMQPSVQSLFALDKRFDPSSVDIMGCASSLGDILRFTRSIASTFRFDVEMVGNTLFLVRNHRGEVIPDVRGYGHSFLDAFTTHEDNGAETKSHQRIVSYSFGGLKCLVRFECDGYFEGCEGDFATMAKRLESLNILYPPNSGSINVKAAGMTVSQDSILEIKTKSAAGEPLAMSDHLPRLWVRQIPNFVTAYHARGNFEDVQKKSVKQDVLNWETEHESELQKFASILRQLIVEVKRASHLKLELRRSGLGPLELREQGGRLREVLPAHWKNMWAEQQHQGEAHLSDEDDSEGCPSLSSQDDESAESDGAAADDDFAFDYTACSPSCGYCGHCA